MNWERFFAMGGYAFYVWSSYAIAALVLVLNVLLPWRRRRVVLGQLREFRRLQDEGR